MVEFFSSEFHVTYPNTSYFFPVSLGFLCILTRPGTLNQIKLSFFFPFSFAGLLWEFGWEGSGAAHGW